MWQLTGVQFQECYPSDYFDGDPDPTFLFDEVPEPTFHYTADTDLDPAPRQSDASLQQLVYSPPPPFPRIHFDWASTPPLWALTDLRAFKDDFDSDADSDPAVDFNAHPAPQSQYVDPDPQHIFEVPG